MKTQHTPGPWVVTGQETERYTSTIRHIDETPRQRKELWVADCTKDDARLIAAAPELLEACKELVANLISHAQLGLNEKEVAMLRRAESAIAKAIGQ